MAKKTTPKTPEQPDQYVYVDIEKLTQDLFNSEGGEKNAEEIKKIISKLSPEDIVGLRGYLGRYEDVCRKINAIVNAEVKSRPADQFPFQDTFLGILDRNTNESYGGVYIGMASKTTYSTEKAKVSTQVKEELQKAGLLNDDFTRTSVEIKRDALFQAKRDGKLPDSIANLLTETTTEEREIAYVPIPIKNKEEK